MNDSQNYEKLIQKKTEGKILLSKILFIIFYTLLAIISVILIIFIGKANPLLFVIGAVIVWLVIKFTWRLTQIEYEYSIFEGTFFLSKILGKASRRDILENQLSEATKVAPYTEQYKNTIDFKRVKRTIKAISSDTAENVWFILFEKESGENVLVLFEADEKSLRLIRRSCPRAVAREKIKNTDGDVKIHESEN